MSLCVSLCVYPAPHHRGLLGRRRAPLSSPLRPRKFGGQERTARRARVRRAGPTSIAPYHLYIVLAGPPPVLAPHLSPCVRRVLCGIVCTRAACCVGECTAISAWLTRVHRLHTHPHAHAANLHSRQGELKSELQFNTARAWANLTQDASLRRCFLLPQRSCSSFHAPYPPARMRCLCISTCPCAYTWCECKYNAHTHTHDDEIALPRVSVFGSRLHMYIYIYIYLTKQKISHQSHQFF